VLARAIRSRVTAPVAVFALVLALRAASLASLVATPLASWHLWMETDEHAYVEWSARLAAGNWADVPAYRAYFQWQKGYGPPETWERWYQKNAYYAGPLYPYGLALVRVVFGAPFLPARILQMLLACVASACLAAAVHRVSEDFLRRESDGREARRRVAPPDGGVRIAFWCAALAGVLYGAYGPLVFHDFFLYRDGPVAHLSTLLLALPLAMRGRSEEKEEKREISSNEESGSGMRRAGWPAFLLGLLGGLAMLLKQTTAPLAFASLYSFSKRFPGGAKRRSIALLGALGLALSLSVLCIRNVSAGVPPLTFDTRQAIGLAQVAGRARRDDVVPVRAPALGARNHVVDRQPTGGSAVLAAEPVAREHGTSRDLAGVVARDSHVAHEADHGRPGIGARRRTHRPVETFHDLGLVLQKQHAGSPH